MAEQRRIAIVDDDPFIRAALGRLIRSSGYEVLLFESAEALLAYGDRQSLFCVLADIQMPDMGGIELIRMVSASSPALPIVAMTAYPGDAIRERALEAGAADYLTKPFDASALERCLARLG
ncbi:two-component response regulator [Azorhizobium oxalatiphilum]|uniref:Two-component response regulator n=1 Tax=Azorhizobium oxalatiphilum TaxID=980631 RepID=A0A917FDP8_9HYPH|nr:response regulator [Azorhizobium oxalatiphilum]GGF68225.1 two-component response regulator [Azorhizobium oxalatiphilum]